MLKMAFEVLSADYPVETVKVRFELPIEDFPEGNIETFRGFLVNETHVIYRSSFRELRIVKVAPTDQDHVYLADGPSTAIGYTKKGERFQAVVYDLVHRLQNLDGWSLLMVLSTSDCELNLTEVL
jgi:hypothetical protein